MHCAADLDKLIFILGGEVKQKERPALFRGVLLNLSGCFLLCGPIPSSICSIYHTHTQTNSK